MASEVDEQTLRDIFEAAPDGIVVVDGAGRIRVVNRQIELLFGYERSELIGQRVEVLVPEGARTAHGQHRAAYVGAPSTRPMGSGLDLFGRRKDGSEFPAEISLSPIRRSDGLLVTAIVRDVTEQKESEEERQQLLARVEAQLVRDAVARDLHDEIIQAVYAVGLNLQAARSQDEVSTDQALERARQELRAVIADLRSYIRHLTTGDEALTTHLLETRLRTLLEQSRGQPSWSVTIELPEDATAGLDRELYLVARELVSNVERHAEAERATLSLRVEGTTVVLEVSDDGRGFERTVVEPESVGLRSVEQRIAELGGSVLIESRPGAGARVIARIPLPAPIEG